MNCSPASFSSLDISRCCSIGKRMSVWTPITITGHVILFSATSIPPNVSPRSNMSTAWRKQSSPRAFTSKWARAHKCKQKCSFLFLICISARNAFQLCIKFRVDFCAQAFLAEELTRVFLTKEIPPRHPPPLNKFRDGFSVESFGLKLAKDKDCRPYL